MEIDKNAKGNMLQRALLLPEVGVLSLIHQDLDEDNMFVGTSRKVSTFYISDKKTTHPGKQRQRREL